MPNTDRDKPPYSVLANIYDAVMHDVDYEVWADFIDEIIQTYRSGATSVLELACGTGSLSLSLDELGYYRIIATDISPEMIEKARRKANQQSASVSFKTMDFLNIDLERTFDVVFSTFDSINYLHHPEQIHLLLDEVKKVLDPESIFIFDFTTPRNSIKSIRHLNNEEGYTEDNFRFFRKSRYDAENQIHYNEFRIDKLDDREESVIDRYYERHEQKIYTLQEMNEIISETDYEVLARYDGFDFKSANKKSLRITMVLRCPTVQS